MPSALSGKRIAILVAEGVEDLEYYVTFMRLQEEGAEVISAGLELKPSHPVCKNRNPARGRSVRTRAAWRLGA